MVSVSTIPLFCFVQKQSQKTLYNKQAAILTSFPRKSSRKKGIVSSTNGGETTRYAHAKEWYWTLPLHYKYKLTERGAYSLNVRAKVIKSFKENMGVNICDLVLNNTFLDMRIKA